MEVFETMAADSSAGIPGGGTEPARNQRYVYLVGRLHNRQMTMEEATELFGIMQVMIRQSEAARMALMRAVPPPPGPQVRERVLAPPVPAASTASDDFFLLGILAMGAGAGLLAAMTRRLSDSTPPSAPIKPANPDSGATSH